MLLGTASTHGTNPNVYTKLSYDPVRDFVPVALITSSPLLLVANNDVPVKTAADLIALAKAKPGDAVVRFVRQRQQQSPVAELFNTMAGIQANHIPYRGSAPMMTDLIGGRIQFAFDGVATTLGYIRQQHDAAARRVTASARRCCPMSRRSPNPPFRDSTASVWFGFVRAGRHAQGRRSIC